MILFVLKFFNLILSPLKSSCKKNMKDLAKSFLQQKNSTVFKLFSFPPTKKNNNNNNQFPSISIISTVPPLAREASCPAARCPSTSAACRVACRCASEASIGMRFMGFSLAFWGSSIFLWVFFDGNIQYCSNLSTIAATKSTKNLL